MPVSDSSLAERWNVHVQATIVGQAHPAFEARYSGLNSLNANPEFKPSLTATVFAGASLWNGGEIYCNPELVGGSGFSGTTGLAGFSNGEIFRIGDSRPTITIARIFLRQSFGWGEDTEFVRTEANQLSGVRPVKRFTVTIGKFSVVDQFDENSYSHDARTQFLDWALMDNGSWDYPADTRGYTWGLTVELHQPAWAFRVYAVMVPFEANGLTMDGNLSRAHGEAVELEYHYARPGFPGSVRLAGYINNARMGLYREALAQSPSIPDIRTSRRDGRAKTGYSASVEQAISDDVGVFFRGGWNDGTTETWTFTEIDRTLSLGVSVSGTAWNQPHSSAGLACVVNGLSQEHRDYLAAGGYGFIIGDGGLSYGSEFITEAYYKEEIVANVFVSGHILYAVNPAYNRDRGPVPIVSVRLHYEI